MIIWLLVKSGYITLEHPWYAPTAWPASSWWAQVLWHRTITNHHAGLAMTNVSHAHELNNIHVLYIAWRHKYCSREIGDCQINSFFIINGFVHNIVRTQCYVQGVCNHRQLDCFFNSLFRITANKHQTSTSLVICEGNPPVIGGFPSQRAQ